MRASRSAARFVRCRPRPSMPRAHRETTLIFTAVRSTTGNSSSRASASCCLESLSAVRARTSRTPSASMSNRTAAATSGPARQPRPASSAPATQRTPSPRSNWTRRRPGRRFTRARRCARVSGSEEPDAAGRPVGCEGAADDGATGNGAPESTVVGLPTIVAHHEPVSGRNRDRRGHRASPVRVVVTRVGDVRVLLALAVADHVAVDDPDDVAGAGDDALDEIDLRLALGRLVARGVLVAALVAARVGLRPDGRVEDDDVADLRVAEAVADPVDEHALADRERRDHRLARNAVRLDEEGLDPERERERDADDDDELYERAARRLLL